MKMCQAFAKGGHDVVLFCRRTQTSGDNPFSFYGVKPLFTIESLYTVPIGGIRHISQTWNAVRRARHLTQPDLLYGRDLYSLAALAYLKLPIIYETHSLATSTTQRTVEIWLLRRANLRRLVVISHALAEDYINAFPWFDPRKIVIAHDGADLPEISPHEVQIQWPGRDGHLQIGYVGHLYPGRGIDVIIKLAEALPEIDFHVIGGTEKDISRWKAGASSKNLLFHGFVPHGLLRAYYRHIDIALAPYQRRVAVSGGKGDISRWISPMKLFEYMAEKKAIIASDLPVLREILNNQNAVLVPPNDIRRWIDAVDLLTDNAIRISLGNKAYLDVATNYTWEKRADNVLSL